MISFSRAFLIWSVGITVKNGCTFVAIGIILDGSGIRKLSSIICETYLEYLGKIVVDGVDDWTELYGIRVVNKQTNEEVLTNEEGRFQLSVNLHDDLIITSGFTDKRKIKISEAILTKGILEVHLDLEVIQLAETTVNTLKSNLKDNIKIVESDKTKLYKLVYIFLSNHLVALHPLTTKSKKQYRFLPS